MLKNYLLVALQHLVKQRLYTLINVAGLATGLACFILIGLFVLHERSYDRQFASSDRIVRISRDFLPTEMSKAAYLATIAPQAAALLQEDFPQIEKIARIECCGAAVGKAGERPVLEDGVAAADGTLFEIFDFGWLRGDARTALEAPFGVVLTRSVAAKHFGTVDPVGQTLLIDDRPYEVTGVIEDLGDHTHLRFSMLTSLSTVAAIYGPERLDNWSFNRYYTYALLREGADAAEIERGSDEFFERRFLKDSSKWTRLDVMPLTDLHLKSRKENEMRVPGSASTVSTFAAIAVFILLIACINFMNLATARSTQRAKEIGVRKAIGAGQRQIVAQFLVEAVLMSAIALVFAMTLVELALPAFNAFLELRLTFDYFSSTPMALGLVALTLLTGLAAGSYPAFYLAAFEPSRVLKGDKTGGGGAALFRKSLVVLQFSISIALLIATAVVHQQTQFARNIELGYDTDRIVVVTSSSTAGFGTQWEALKREWLTNPDVTQVTASMLTPGMQNTNALGFAAEGRESDGTGMAFVWVDYEFFETYGIQVLQGRTFDERFGDRRIVAGPDGAKAGSYVLSESAARRFGWTPSEAIGKRLEQTFTPNSNGEIVGVVRDVYFESVRDTIEPVVYLMAPEPPPPGFVPTPHASLRVSGRNLAAALEHIDAKWAEILPEQPISRHFLDEDFEALYRGEERQGQMFTLFAALAISVACLGLLGLASFTTERRTKEIGIRKAIGGSVLDIVVLLSGELSKLVLLANLLAWPAAYLLMQR